MTKKEPIKPLVDLRAPFADSLANFTQKTIMLLSAVDAALKLDGSMKPAVAEVLRKQHDEVHAALFGDRG